MNVLTSLSFQSRRNRHRSLSSWSPYDIAACFKVATPDKPPVFPLSSSVECATGHVPRYDVHRERTFVYPRMFVEPPLRPHVSSSSEEKNKYAIFALSLFYPFDRHLDDLTGRTLWDKYVYWNDNRPRLEMDNHAFRCLDNIEVRQNARAQMRIHSLKQRVLAKATRAANVSHPLDDICPSSSASVSYNRYWC